MLVGLFKPISLFKSEPNQSNCSSNMAPEFIDDNTESIQSSK